MRFSYSFANLCGAVYNNGNVVFSPDGNILYSPVGNRVTVFDLVNHSSYTLPFECRENISRIAISHNGRYLIAADESGHNVTVNLKKRIVLYRTNFGSNVDDMKFSPNDEYLAVTHDRVLQIWYCPTEERRFAPFELFKELGGHSDKITVIDWSSDSQYLVTGSCDTTVRLWSCGRFNGFEPVTLAGHHDRIIGAYFAEDDNAIYSIGHDGGVYEWRWRKTRHEEGKEETDEEKKKREEIESTFRDEFETSKYYNGKWRIYFKNFIEKNRSTIDTCSFNLSSKLLTCGFSNGIFGIYTMPSSVNIHTLNISQRSLSTSAINSSGDWIAFGSKSMGQLLVWEWQSETYILKQQGHYNNISSLDYSPDGSIIATGGEDSKVKLWNTNTGYCYVTFKEHTANVTGVSFVKSGHALVSCSLDGTVRAYDLIRYRNFRILTTPTPVQFTCVAVDSSGDIVAAGSSDPFSIYIWSLRTGKLLDVLNGHEAPISSLAFDPTGSLLLSTSWDNSAMVWDIFGGANRETLMHNSEVLSCAWRPDGLEACTTTLTGDIYVWDVKNGVSKTTIEGRRDITGGRRTTDNVSLKHIAIGKCFDTVCYSADGQYIIAAGRSKYVCIYCLENRLLIKKFQLSQNRSLEGIQDKLNSKNMTEAGALGLLDISDNEDDTTGLVLPGVAKGDASKRSVKNEIRCSCVKFSPSGESFSCSTNQGLLIYSLDPSLSFEPFDIREDVTPSRIDELINNEDFSKALIYSLHLNVVEYIKKVLSFIPLNQIQVIAKEVPRLFLTRLFQVLCEQLTKTPYVEYYISWCLILLQYHGEFIRSNPRRYISVLRNLQKVLTLHYSQTQKIFDQNLYLLNYLTKSNSFDESIYNITETNDDNENEDIDMNNDHDDDHFLKSINTITNKTDLQDTEDSFNSNNDLNEKDSESSMKRSSSENESDNENNSNAESSNAESSNAESSNAESSDSESSNSESSSSESSSSESSNSESSSDDSSDSESSSDDSSESE